MSSLNVGGTENHIRRIFPKLQGSSYQIAIYTTHQRGIMTQFLKAKGVKVYGSYVAQCLHRLGGLGRLCAYAVSVGRLLLLNLYYRPHIVHCYLPGPYILGGLCAYITRRPYLIMSRRSMNFYQKKHPYLAKWEQYLQRKTSFIVANSKRILNQLLNEEMVKRDQLRLIYNGLDVQSYRPCDPLVTTRSSLGISENALVMTIVANLFFYKGHMDLLKALVLIKKRLPKDWILLCVGRDEGCLQSLCNYAIQHDIALHIQWLNQRDDVPALLSISNIGILCSHEEGFSNSIIEGMAAGLPMVVTDVGGNNEAVIHNETGLVVPSKDPKALGQAILQLIENKTLREYMGRAALRRVEAKFSLDSCLNAYRQLYAELT